MSKRKQVHISWKNHNIDTYIEHYLQVYLDKKVLKCNECGSIEMNKKYANKPCVWCDNGVMKIET